MKTFNLARRSAVLVALAVIVALLSPIGAGSASIDPDTTSTETLARSLFADVMVDGDIEVATRIIAPDAEIRTEWGELAGPDGLLAYLDAARQTFPDLTFELLEVSVRGDFVTIRWQADLGERTFHGRTLAAVEDGAFTRILLLDESQLAVMAGQGSSAAGGMGVQRSLAGGPSCPPQCIP